MSEREKLAPRRASITESIAWTMESGNTKTIPVTFGFNTEGQVREVFTSSFKAGSDVHAIVIDASILISLLMQHGHTAEYLLPKLCDPHSLIGRVIAAAARINAANLLNPPMLLSDQQQEELVDNVVS